MTPQKMRGFRLSQTKLAKMPNIFQKGVKQEWQRFIERIQNKGLFYRFVMNEKEKNNEN